MSGEDDTTDKVLDAGALPALKRLLEHDKHGVRKEACWSLSNVLAGTESQIQAVMDEDIIPIVLLMLATDRFDVKKEAAWCIANAVSGASPHQIIVFAQQNCIPALCSLLKIPDVKLLDMTLDALNRTLKVGMRIQASRGLMRNPYADIMYSCGGVDTLEGEIQNHSNTQIYKKTQVILTKYFKQEEEETSQPTTNETYQFNVGVQNAPYDL